MPIRPEMRADPTSDSGGSDPAQFTPVIAYGPQAPGCPLEGPVRMLMCFKSSRGTPARVERSRRQWCRRRCVPVPLALDPARLLPQRWVSWWRLARSSQQALLSRGALPPFGADPLPVVATPHADLGEAV